MLDVIKKILGIGPAVDYAGLLMQGGVIIDVRTRAEYRVGHIKGSINIPLNNLPNHYSSIKRDKPIITCCASGVRSQQAKKILSANGFKQVYNGGGWVNLQNKIN